MLARDDWLPLARKLNCEFSYTTEQEVFLKSPAGIPGFHTPVAGLGRSFQDVLAAMEGEPVGPGIPPFPDLTSQIVAVSGDYLRGMGLQSPSISAN